jgi:hypothetical protein
MRKMGKRQPKNKNGNLPVARFGFRLSNVDPEDVRLSYLMAADIESGAVNLSVVTRTLLLRWYEWRQMSGELGVPGFLSLNMTGAVSGTQEHNAIQTSEQEEDPNDLLVQRLVGISVSDWE